MVAEVQAANNLYGSHPTIVQWAHVEDLKPGDIVAVNYGTDHKPTGHVMMIDRAPAHDATSPIEPGLQQYEAAVIDSANSGHGSLDTRFAGGLRTTGAGCGALRLYANADGTVAGYTWSTKRVSQFYPVADRKIAFGRYTGVPSIAAPKQPPTKNADDVPDQQ